jgi:sulfopyruvate decarboxylase alpha subunit
MNPMRSMLVSVVQPPAGRLHDGIPSIRQRRPGRPTIAAMENPPPWQERIYALLKAADVRQVAYVPDAGHAHVIRRAQADPDMRDIVLTTEEEGVALAAGAWLGGQRAVLLMQSSGVGNCVNLFSLLHSADVPFVALVTMRGEHAEFNPWQCPMGRAAQGAMELMGLAVHRADTPEEVEEVVGAALDAAFLGGQRVAVLLSQRLIGRKRWTGR